MPNSGGFRSLVARHVGGLAGESGFVPNSGGLRSLFGRHVFGFSGSTSSPPPPPPPTPAGRPAKRRIEWMPPGVNLDGTPRAPMAEPPRSIKLSKVARKLARVQARARSDNPDTAAKARAYLDQLRADADSEIGRLLARQQQLDEQRRIAAADEEEAVMAFIAWLMES